MDVSQWSLLHPSASLISQTGGPEAPGVSLHDKFQNDSATMWQRRCEIHQFLAIVVFQTEPGAFIVTAH